MESGFSNWNWGRSVEPSTKPSNLMPVVATWKVEMGLAYVLWVFVSASGLCVGVLVLNVVLSNICLVSIFVQVYSIIGSKGTSRSLLV